MKNALHTSNRLMNSALLHLGSFVFAILLFAATAMTGVAQQDVLTGQYLFNGMIINPAYAGTGPSWETMALQRLQWVEFDGSPSTGILSAHGPVGNKSLGAGASLSLDAIGITSTMELSGHAAYHVELKKGHLDLGLRGGMIQYRARLSEAVVVDPSDPVYQGTQLSSWVPRFGFGAMYRSDLWFLGVSAPMLFVPSQGLEADISPYYKNHLYVQAGMNVRPNKWLTLSPSVLHRSTPDVPSVLDLNLLATMSDAYTVGLGFRPGNSITMLTQCRINSQFRIGYARDFATTDIRSYAGGTHEIVLGWDMTPSNKGGASSQKQPR